MIEIVSKGVYCPIAAITETNAQGQTHHTIPSAAGVYTLTAVHNTTDGLICLRRLRALSASERQEPTSRSSSGMSMHPGFASYTWRRQAL
jgi:hypothetical protein